MWLGANSKAVIVSKIEPVTIPLNKNSTEGIIDSASALKTLLFLKQIAPPAR